MKNQQVGLGEDLVRSIHAWVAVDLFSHPSPTGLRKIFSEPQFSCLLNEIITIIQENCKNQMRPVRYKDENMSIVNDKAPYRCHYYYY